MPLTTLGKIHEDRPVITIRVNTNLQEAAQLMAAANVGALPVVDAEGQLIGIISERDIVRRGVATACNLCATTVGTMMTRRVCVADPEEDYRMGLAKMQNMNCRHLPIVKEGKTIGIVSMRDLLAHQLADYEFDVRMLEKYITS